MKLSYPSNKICPKCGTGGYVWYLDDSEYIAKCINCGHYFCKEDFPMCVLDSVPKRKTNGDKIRAMTDEELAEFNNGVEAEAIRRAGRFITAGDIQRGKEGWLDWLKKEVE